MAFKDNLRALRKQKGLSQQDLAAQFDYKSFTTIQKWEDGTSFPPSETLRRLADFFRVSMDQLMGETQEDAVSVPILGIVRGGPLRLAEQEVIGQEWVDRSEARGGEHFYLEVTGNSMIGARIFPGDLVYVKRQNQIENGQIGVVLVGDEATLKRVYFEGDRMILRAENETYAPMIFSKEEIDEKPVRILGRVLHNKIKF
ncbi:MAG: LexA family protein [Erysipelotrichaceae bacterium]